MSVLKSELKQLVTHEIGVRVEDAHEAAKRELAVLEGRQAAFADGAKAMEALVGFMNKEVEEGKLELPLADAARRWVTRGGHALLNLSKQAEIHRSEQTGKVRGLEQTVALLKNMLDAEKAKSDALKQTSVGSLEVSEEDKSRPVSRPVGEHPKPTIKAQRLAEEAAPTVPAGVKKRRGGKSNAPNA